MGNDCLILVALVTKLTVTVSSGDLRLFRMLDLLMTASSLKVCFDFFFGLRTTSSLGEDEVAVYEEKDRNL